MSMNYVNTWLKLEVPKLKKLARNSHSLDIKLTLSDDIERAAKKIKVLGNGFQVLSVGSQKMIQSVFCLYKAIFDCFERFLAN